MLNAMREGAKAGFLKFILMGFMVLAVGGLVLMDVGGFFRGGVARTHVAQIEDQKLAMNDFDRLVRRTLASQGLDTETAYRLGFIQQILQTEISKNILQYAARDLGLQVGDDAVMKQITRLVEPLTVDGRSRREALARVLQSQGMTEQELVDMVKAEMTNMLLRNAIQIGSEVPADNEARDIYKHRKEERTVKAIFLPHDDITDVADPADEILMPLYQAGRERFAIPESRSFTIAVLTQDKLKDTIAIDEQELRDIYEQDILTFSLPERRVLEQAVLSNQATATAIAAAVTDGATLEAAVENETGNADGYLGQENFEQAGLLEEIGEPAFAATVGDVVGPIETALGWHVIRIDEILEPETQPFEEVRSQLEEEIIQTRLMDDMFIMANAIDDSLAGGAALEDTAAEMDMNLQTLGPVTEMGASPDQTEALTEFQADRAMIIETLFALGEGEISPVIELSNGDYAALRVDTITAKSYEPFEDVRDSLAATWVQDQKEVANQIRAREALQALNAGDKSLQQVASDFGRSINTYDLVRDEPAEAPVNNNVKLLFYNLPQASFGMAPADEGFLLGQITDVRLPETSDLTAEDLQPYRDIVRGGMQNEFAEMFFLYLQSRYDVSINERLLTQTYGPGSEQF